MIHCPIWRPPGGADDARRRRRAATRASTSGPSIHGIGVAERGCRSIPRARRTPRSRVPAASGAPALHLPMQKREKMTPSRSSRDEFADDRAERRLRRAIPRRRARAAGGASARWRAAAATCVDGVAQGQQMPLAREERAFHVLVRAGEREDLLAAAGRCPSPVFADRKTWRDGCAPSCRRPSTGARVSPSAHACEIDLVVDDDARQRCRQRVEDRAVARPVTPSPARCIDQHERQIRARDRGPRALDAERLDRIVGRAQPRGVDDASAECRRSRSARSTASRVVPAIGVTIATSSPASRLSRLDLPTFGRPISTTVSPSRNSAPCFARARTSREPRRRSRRACRARRRRAGNRYPRRENRASPR